MQTCISISRIFKATCVIFHRFFKLRNYQKQFSLGEYPIREVIAKLKMSAAQVSHVKIWEGFWPQGKGVTNTCMKKEVFGYVLVPFTFIVQPEPGCLLNLTIVSFQCELKTQLMVWLLLTETQAKAVKDFKNSGWALSGEAGSTGSDLLRSQI